ncbi:MAG: fimbria major subunit [Prevotella sp.]|nr:fimbria major subunit [Prevotella sp.]
MIRKNKIERRLRQITAEVGSVIVCFIILSVSGCTGDEPLVSSGERVFDSDEAYLPVNITSGGSPMLLNAGDDDVVANAHFYFYDSKGYLVTEGEIDFSDYSVTGKKIVILTDMTGKAYPKYVVTVLNQPSGFNYGNTLAEMQAIKTEEDLSPVYDGSNNNNLVMSTSTYSDEDRPYNFVTEIGEGDFVEGHVPSDLSDITQVIDIPIERLAAKVTVEIGSLTNGTVNLSGEDSRTLYKINDTQYVEILGWKINAVARESNIFKNIEDIDNPLGGWSWNDAANTRCYWAKSFNYGLGSSEDYPEDNSQGNTDDDEESASTRLSSYLKYVSLKDGLTDMGNSDFCAENTNTVGEDGIIKDLNSSAITSVLIKARACDVEGNALTDLTGYTEGLMYYNIPIRHTYNDNDEDVLSEGEYGVVRNYHYTITITQLSDLGTGIENEEEVIVPGNQDYNIKFSTTILPWKVQEVDVDYGETIDGN